MRIVVDGRVRSARVHLPPSASGQGRLPLVIVLHGDGGTGDQALRVSQMNDSADANGFVAVYPNGASWRNIPWRSWNAGNCCGYAQARHIDDVGFLRTLIDALIERQAIDPRRVYLTGVSNGGMMAYRAACELSDRIAAIAPVAATLASTPCAPEHPISVLAFHGTADPYVRYAGGPSLRALDRRVDLPVEDAVAFWVRHNHCTGGPQETMSGRVKTRRYTGCRDGAEVALITIEGGPHAWPRMGAAAMIWEFFARHRTRDE